MQAPSRLKPVDVTTESLADAMMALMTDQDLMGALLGGSSSSVNSSSSSSSSRWRLMSGARAQDLVLLLLQLVHYARHDER